MSAPDWIQTDSEVVVKIPLDDGVGKDKLNIKFESSRATVKISGAVVFAKELSGKVVPDDSYWAIEKEDDKRLLLVTLGKKKSGKWKVLTKEEEEALPEADIMDANFDVMALEHDDDDPERVEEQEANEKKLEARYKKLLSEKGLESEDTLETFFALFDNCIQLYRLNKLYDYLQEVVPAVRKRTDKYKLKGVQALAFVLWKQSKFREALPLFHEMEDILGKGAALCENIAHTYNSLGNYEKAEDYFRQALKFIEQEHGMNKGNRGGVLLGLGLVRDRLGRHSEALPVCRQAYEFYRDRAHGSAASLQAKAAISCAKISAKLGDLPSAEKYIREAVTMYEVTCGETSPLTASAYHELGRCLWEQRKREDAQKALKRAYEIESMKDAWDLVTLLEIHNLLMDTHLKECDQIDRPKFAEYFDIVTYVLKRVRKELPQDGNAAVYYKAVAELKAWGGRYEEAKGLFNEAIPLFKAEKATDCSGLISGCNDMLAFCDRNLAGTQASPMNFEVPQSESKAAKEAGGGDDFHDAVEIEEVSDEVADQIKAEKASKRDASKGSPQAAAAPEITYRTATPDDYVASIRLCAQCRAEPLVESAEAFERHLQGPGAGLCLVAVRGDDLCGLALCGSDGIFGNILQLLATGPEDEATRQELARRCVDACGARHLRALRALGNAPSESPSLFEKLGWSAGAQLFTTPCGEERPPKKSRVDGSSSSSSAAPSSSAAAATKAAQPPAISQRDGKSIESFYKEWDKLDVDKALVKEDGLDPAIVPPERERPQEEFSSEGLDVSNKLTKYAWDQSDRFVSLYFDFDGAGKLSDEAVEIEFKPRGFLLTVKTVAGRAPRWFKVPNLCQDIQPTASTKKVKADSIVVKLKKSSPAEWSDLTDEKDVYKRRREFRINHGDLKGASTEELIADMYQHANDDDRSGLRDAMRVNREKRSEDAKQEAKKASAPRT